MKLLNKIEFMEQNPGATGADYADYISQNMTEEDYTKFIQEYTMKIIDIDLKIKELNQEKSDIKSNFTDHTAIPGSFLTDAVTRLKKVMGWGNDTIEDEKLVFSTIFTDSNIVSKMQELTEKYDSEDVVEKEAKKYKSD